MSASPASMAVQDINRLIDQTLDQAEQILSQIPIRRRDNKVSVRHVQSGSKGAADMTRDELRQVTSTSDHHLLQQCNKFYKHPSNMDERQSSDGRRGLFEIMKSKRRTVDGSEVPDGQQLSPEPARTLDATVSRDQLIDSPGLGPVPLRPVDSLELAKVRRLDPDRPDIPQFLHSPLPQNGDTQPPSEATQLAVKHAAQLYSRPVQPPIPFDASQPSKFQYPDVVPLRQRAAKSPSEQVVPSLGGRKQPLSPSWERSPPVSTGRTSAGPFPPISSTEGVKVAPERTETSRVFSTEPTALEPSNHIFNAEGTLLMGPNGHPLQLRDPVYQQPLPPVPGGYLMNANGSLCVDAEGRPVPRQSLMPAVQSQEQIVTEPDRVRLERHLMAGPILPSTGVYLAQPDGQLVTDQNGNPIRATNDEGQPLRFSSSGVMVDPSGAVVLDQNRKPIPAFDRNGKAYKRGADGCLVDSEGRPLLDSCGRKVPAVNVRGEALRPEQCLIDDKNQLILDPQLRPMVPIDAAGKSLKPALVSTEFIDVRPKRALLERTFTAESPRSPGQTISSRERTAVAPSSVSQQRTFTIGSVEGDPCGHQCPDWRTRSICTNQPCPGAKRTSSSDALLEWDPSNKSGRSTSSPIEQPSEPSTAVNKLSAGGTPSSPGTESLAEMGGQVCETCGLGEFLVHLKINVKPGATDPTTGQKRHGRAEVTATCHGVTPVDVFLGPRNVWHQN